MQPVGLAALALLWALILGYDAQAQKSIGDLHATANGEIESIYNDSFGNLDGTAGHSLGFAGKGTISGDYYNPDFLSFTVLPYYGRSQDNAETESLTNASGYMGTLNIFKGSHFPGVVSFQQNWNNAGNFGIPGVAGLTTVNNNHAFNIGWSALLPGLPTLTVGFVDTAGTSSLLGSTESTDSSNRNFNIGSTYNFHSYYLNGGFIHMLNNVGINGLENGETETSNGSSNQYRFLVQGPIPYRHSSMSASFTRTSYNTDDLENSPGNSTNDIDNGTTDTINANATLAFPRAPVTVTTMYTDNLLGSIEQQLTSSGQVPLFSLNSPESHSISVEASSFVTVLPRLMVGGFVERTEQLFNGQSFGVTEAGLTLNYSFFRVLKGLTLYGGLTDSATQGGNSWLGFIGDVNYNRSFRKWQLNGFFLYNQNTQTLLAIYTTSTLNYGGKIKYLITPDLAWAAMANINKSGFNQVAGDSSHAESFTTMLIWKKAAMSAFYSQSDGTAILTSTGLVTTPVPSQVLAPGDSILYAGKNYGATVSLYPIRHMVVSGSWSKSFANTDSPLLLSNDGNTNYYGFLGYEYRKLMFTSQVVKFNQFISNSGTAPSMLTSYSFGVQRWFKGF
jgi:hypothetical protein